MLISTRIFVPLQPETRQKTMCLSHSMHKFLFKILLLAVFFVNSNKMMAQADSVSLRPSFSVDMISELQTDFKRAKWGNLLELHADVPLSRKFTFNFGSISYYTNDEELFIDNLQIYSNIDAYNKAFAFTVAGFTWQINDRHSLFAGIRRMDEDYFCSDVISFFTNSSCGGFPTLFYNYPVATYPMASLGMHYVYDYKNITLQASLYNGISYQDLSGRDNVFRFCPKSDGIFFASQLEYRYGDSHYFLGGSVYEGDFDEEDEPRKLRPSLWTYAEQALAPNLSLIGAYSHAFCDDDLCFDFAGIGAKYSLGRFEFGVFSDYMRTVGLFEEDETIEEWATEFTCNVSLTKFLSFQPVLHVIRMDGETNCVGVFRLNVSF